MPSTTATIMKSWKTALEPLGFRVSGSGALRSVGKLSHSLWIQRSRWERERLRLNLNIGIWDPFLADPGFTVALTAHIERDGVRFAEHEAWWTEAQAAEILSAFVEFGPPWFAAVAGTPGQLLALFETAIAENKPIQYLFEGLEGEAHPAIADLVAQLGTTLSVPRIYWEFASLLAYFEGDRRKACEYASRWLRQVERGTRLFADSEPERTLAQLRKMGCETS